MENSIMNRPVTAADIAAKLGLSASTITQAMSQNPRISPATVELIRRTASEMGYDSHAVRSYYGKCGCLGVGKHRATVEQVKAAIPSLKHSDTPVFMHNIAAALGISIQSVKRAYAKNIRGQKGTEELNQLIYIAGQIMGYVPGHSKPHKIVPLKRWHGGNFYSHEEEIARMKELRAQGFSNAEIARKVGRVCRTVVNNIGAQDPALTLHNNRMAHKMQALKNEGRRVYLRNSKVERYNAKVAAHNKMKAELNALQVELLTEKPEIETVAAQRIEMPQINLELVQPAALM